MRPALSVSSAISSAGMAPARAASSSAMLLPPVTSARPCGRKRPPRAARCAAISSSNSLHAGASSAAGSAGPSSSALAQASCRSSLGRWSSSTATVGASFRRRVAAQVAAVGLRLLGLDHAVEGADQGAVERRLEQVPHQIGQPGIGAPLGREDAEVGDPLAQGAGAAHVLVQVLHERALDLVRGDAGHPADDAAEQLVLQREVAPQQGEVVGDRQPAAHNRPLPSVGVPVLRPRPGAHCLPCLAQ